MNLVRGVLMALAVLVSLPTFSALAQTLPQMMEQLRTNPADDALRQRIIDTARAMTTAPPVPGEAERFLARGAAATKAATSPNDFRAAAAEFQKAADAAPWLPEAYYNRGVVLEKAGDPAGALAAYRWYLAAAPDAPDARAVRTKTFELEYLAEKAAKASAPEEQAKRTADEFGALLKLLDGAIFRGRRSPAAVDEIRIKGGVATYGKFNTNTDETWLRANPRLRNNPFTVLYSAPLTGFVSRWQDAACRPFDVSSLQPGQLVLSRDGRTLTEKVVCSGQERIGQVFYKQD